MDKQDLERKIKELEKQIEDLPVGSIGTKNIKNRTYYYHRYYQDGRRIEKYIDNSDVLKFKKLIEHRKLLEKEYKELINISKRYKYKKEKNKFLTNVRVGDELKDYVNPVLKYKHRELLKDIEKYIYSNIFDKVFILYGLRRTGKTTLLRQTILKMNDDDFSQTAFIQITPNDDLGNLNKDLRELKKLGYKYIFIDEATLMEDFIEGAALLSDIYAATGMKIVLSGTDSLGFVLSESEQLFDRCILLHTTFISYREFENVLGINGIDEYIRYGGTMSLSGVNYNGEYVFNDKVSTNEYIDTAIAKNIQHSLKYYDNGNHFRHLRELYENNELTNVINRVVEDINHRFTKDVLIKEFKSNDFALSKRNIRKDKDKPSTILDDIDQEQFTLNLKKMLEILNVNEQKVQLQEIHSLEIKEYLKLLDLVFEVDIRTIPTSNNIEKSTIITQPGLRYSQAKALIDSLLLDEKFMDLSLKEKQYFSIRILNEIKGRMMEDIILLETKMAYPKCEVFKLKFAVGEFDMVIFDPISSSCEIYEIKFGREVYSSQYQHLINEEKLKVTEFNYGDIKRRGVIYNGISHFENGVEYINVEEYLSFKK